MFFLVLCIILLLLFKLKIVIIYRVAHIILNNLMSQKLFHQFFRDIGFELYD